MEYHKIKVVVNSSIAPPAKTFLGSTIRGALGRVLEKEDAYVYNLLYDKKNHYHPFRVDVEHSKNFDFNIYVFKNDIAVLRALLAAIKKMLNSKLLTKQNFSFPNSEIFLNSEKILFDSNSQPKPFALKPMQFNIEPKDEYNITLLLWQPCQIKDKNSSEEYKIFITLEDILTSIYKRHYFYTYGVMQHKTEEVKKILQLRHRVYFIKLFRKVIYREKQLKEGVKLIGMEGMVGEIKISNLHPEIYKYLKLGEILGVGRSTAFGLGKIKVIEN